MPGHSLERYVLLRVAKAIKLQDGRRLIDRVQSASEVWVAMAG